MPSEVWASFSTWVTILHCSRFTGTRVQKDTGTGTRVIYISVLSFDQQKCFTKEILLLLLNLKYTWQHTPTETASPTSTAATAKANTTANTKARATANSANYEAQGQCRFVCVCDSVCVCVLTLVGIVGHGQWREGTKGQLLKIGLLALLLS